MCNDGRKSKPIIISVRAITTINAAAGKSFFNHLFACILVIISVRYGYCKSLLNQGSNLSLKHIQSPLTE